MTQDLKPIIAARTKAARKARGITQAALAEAVSRTVEAISNIERGLSLPPLDLLQRIAETLGVALADLLEVPVAHATGNIGERAVLEMEIRAVAASLPIAHLRIAARQVTALAELAANLKMPAEK